MVRSAESSRAAGAGVRRGRRGRGWTPGLGAEERSCDLHDDSSRAARRPARRPRTMPPYRSPCPSEPAGPRGSPGRARLPRGRGGRAITYRRAARACARTLSDHRARLDPFSPRPTGRESKGRESTRPGPSSRASSAWCPSLRLWPLAAAGSRGLVSKTGAGPGPGDWPCPTARYFLKNSTKAAPSLLPEGHPVCRSMRVVGHLPRGISRSGEMPQPLGTLTRRK